MVSSSLTYSRRYHVFPSFHGPDVRRTFLSHLHKHLASKGITTFKDQGIERGNSIGPELVQAIRESRLSIVVLSKNYASSSWCLDELVEIFNCKADRKQIVMTIFYHVDPADVRKQIGDFGIAFKKTCEGKTELEKQKWSQALNDVANIAGEHSLNWDDEGGMIEKIATDVSEKLNVITQSRDFEGMVGMEAHLNKLNSLLCLECDEVKMIGIWGPAGIGKTTIARVLYNQLSSDFRLKCFMGNLKRSYKSIIGVDDYDMNLILQRQLLSKILNQKNMKIDHLGAIKEWLQDQRVLIVLDDVDDLEQLEVLAKEHSWFGSGSRIIITTEDKRILKAHEVSDIYPVGFLSKEDALKIFCLSAFKKSYPRHGFEELAKKVAILCGNLPLGLRVVGSSLRGETKVGWELQLDSLETSIDRKIQDVLRVGYDKLLKKHQAIFIHIACLFNDEDVDHVTSMLADCNLDVKNGLKILADKALVHISTDGKIVMHYLLQKLGRQEVVEQSSEPGNRQFLVEAEDIVNVLANGTGTESVIGISFDMSKTRELFISAQAFERMRNLQFLRVYMGGSNANVSLCTLERMEFLPRLRLLHWYSYPGTSLLPIFRSEFLIELNMPSSKLEKLWEGIQPLANLKKVNLNFCIMLKEIPNLSKATSLETLTLIQCTSLVKFPCSILDLHKLKTVRMWGCKKLQVVPTNNNLASVEKLDTYHSSRLRSFPDISRNIKNLCVGGPSIVGLPWSQPKRHIGRDLKRLTHVPENIRKLDLSSSGIEKIPDYVSDLTRLQTLIIENCRKLVLVADLPRSLKSLHADNCVSLERVDVVFKYSVRELMFRNCLRLGEDARRKIIDRSEAKYVCLPSKKLPAAFTHKARGNSITISWESASLNFKAGLLLLPIEDNTLLHVTCYLRSEEGVLINQINYLALASDQPPEVRTQHLFLISGDLSYEQSRSPKVGENTSVILFEFTCSDNHKILECGVRMEEYEDFFDSQPWLNETEDDDSDWTVCESEAAVDNISYQNDEAEAVNGECNYEAEVVDNIIYQKDEDEAEAVDDAAEAEALGNISYKNVENVDSTKRTGCWSCIRKLWSKKKKKKAPF